MDPQEDADERGERDGQGEGLKGLKGLSGADRFILGYVLLSALIGICYVAFSLLAEDRTESAPAPAWARWEPSGQGERLFEVIAAGVGARYGIGSSSPLTLVASGPPTDAEGRILDGVATTGDGPKQVLEARHGVEYTLCGPDSECLMPASSPALERLLRRQALELALYTFHYETGVEFVLAYLPGAADGTPPRALLLLRGDLSGPLASPLRDTLKERERRLSPEDSLGRREESRIDSLTRDRVFSFHFLDGEAGKAVVLSPYPPPAGA